ncbi:MAG: DEAD/DEAH box helicase family protein [Flavobacteriales bacterium]|nr:DEAD/DEAH box helicase family protein [Flavobacteriales bacterium]
MEPKPYQQRVLEDLGSYLDLFQHIGDPAKTFELYWERKAGPYDPLTGKGMRPYQDNVPGAIHLCVKVPTAGGKTFIAVNALETVFGHYGPNAPRCVVWLVPWSNLLQQTVRTLGDPDHPYRQKLNTLFRHRVEVYEKDQLLMGAGFNPTSVQEQLSIIVMSFASLRARKKADRKVFQENGQLAGFRELYEGEGHIKPGTDDTALINVIRHLNPVVVVDESHNAESDLSVDMLQDLNPSFVLDLTATPKKNSNIISMVPAMELKKEHMVKLPVIVYNQHDRHEVIENALHLRQRLESIANAEKAAGGRHIRPIVLFQAQPRTGEENVTFEKVKHLLMKAGIPEQEIKIKTADKDELKGVDLMAEDCPVRYIITINALKEGWDCPYAYVLASLADKSSAVDVEQILGRVLRQPYVMPHGNPMLNMSYVLTASAKFQETLEGIVKALQESGFSDKDYRAVDSRTEAEKEGDKLEAVQMALLKDEDEDDEDLERKPITFDPQAASAKPTSDLKAIEERALAQNAELEEAIEAASENPEDPILQEMGEQVYRYAMRDDVAGLAKGIVLPRFVVEVPGNIFTGDQPSWDELSQEPLLKDFRLSAQNTEIDWDSIESELYSVDIEKTTGGQINPAFKKILQSEVREPVMDYILAKPAEARLNDVADQILARIGNMWPIADQEIKKYVVRLLEPFTTEQLHDVLQRPLAYTGRIHKKVQALAEAAAEKNFKEMLQIGKIRTEPHWRFSERLVPGKLGPSIAISLYEREGDMNNYEARAITELGGLPNIACWHRNLGRSKGFSINGFSNNHYPDFILLTKSGKVIIIETKGDDRDNSDSAAKARLGRIWQDQCGPNFRYFMVFDQSKVDGAYTLSDAKRLVGEVG